MNEKNKAVGHLWSEYDTRIARAVLYLERAKHAVMKADPGTSNNLDEARDALGACRNAGLYLSMAKVHLEELDAMLSNYVDFHTEARGHLFPENQDGPTRS